MTAINVSSENKAYSSVNGVLYTKSRNKLICCPGGYKGDLVIPDGVTRIMNYSFNECSGLTSVTIPDSVTIIADDAFNGCNLTIYGSTGSYAQTYAVRNHIPFVSI